MSVTMRPDVSESMPRIREWPLLGSAAAARGDILGLLARVARECGDIGGFRIGPRQAVFVNAPRLVHTVFVERVNEYGKGEILMRGFRPLFGNGLTTNHGESHRRQRELIAPTFTSRAVAQHVETVIELTLQRAAGWADGASFNLHDELGRLTMSIAGRVLFGCPFPDEEALRAAVADCGDWAMFTMTHPYAPPLSVPIPPNRRVKKALDVVRQQLGRLIDERWDDVEGRNDVVSCLRRARDRQGRPMSREQLYDEMRTIGAGSVESTTDSLTWTIALLVQHPEIYDRLRREADTVLGDRPPTAADLPSLPYALQVFKEALRVYPPASVLTRAALVDTELGGYPIRKGTAVILSPYLLHRRADVFPEPERFDPDRFRPEQERALPRGAYVPFGSGVRTCIGNHFALMEGQLILATLAQKVRFELLPGQRIVPVLKTNLRPRGGVLVRVRRRGQRVSDSAPHHQT